MLRQLRTIKAHWIQLFGVEDQPPNLDEVDELDGHWTEQTTITVSRYTKARLNKQRDEQPWDQYLEKLRRAHADPLTFTDVQQIAEHLSENVGADVDIDELEDRIVTRLARETQSDLQSFEEQLEKIANSASMAAEPTFGDEQVKEIINRIDDLQSQLPKDVKQELQ